MPSMTKLVRLLGPLLLAVLVMRADARSIPPVRPRPVPAGTFLVVDTPLGGQTAPDAKQPPAHLAGGTGAAQVVVSGDRAWVSDRDHDRIVAVAIGKQELTQSATFATRTEP